MKCLITDEVNYDVVHQYYSRPVGETDFQIDTTYYRELWRYRQSGHFISLHDLPLMDLYTEKYAQCTYGDIHSLEKTFQKIMNLPIERSDNYLRVQTIAEFMQKNCSQSQHKVLDVGSGTCVFLARLQDYHWKGTALDPDPSQAQHARNLGFNVIENDWMEVNNIEDQFDLITFNKILEHVIDPIEALRRAHLFIKKTGVVYIELPDCDQAWKDTEQAGREEFFIEHHHGFSKASVEILVERAGFNLLQITSVVEPSGKYSFRVFLQKAY